MKLRESKIFRILLLPFLFAVLGCLPWLIAKFIVKTDLGSSVYAFAIFVIMWLLFLASRILQEKLPQKEREQLAWSIGENYFKKGYVPVYGIVVFIIFVILITLLHK